MLQHCIFSDITHYRRLAIVADTDHFDKDRDPSFHSNTIPEPTYQSDTDTDQDQY
jgi:hypothetical protein